MNVSPYTLGAVESGLFQKIVTQQLPPGPGPQAALSDPNLSSLFATAHCVTPTMVTNATQRIER
ncbi:MAG: hypothetical protein WBC94_11730 [Xanthobacteraceae bacterium]